MAEPAYKYEPGSTQSSRSGTLPKPDYFESLTPAVRCASPNASYRQVRHMLSTWPQEPTRQRVQVNGLKRDEEDWASNLRPFGRS